MSGWGSGYVTDITYMTGYHRHQTPSMMSLACLLGNVAAPLPGPDDEVSYLELGCGQGFGALLLAASNPRWKVTAIDFHPAHIATAREWVVKAELDNIRFLEADLSTLAEDAASAAVPEADYVSLHGVWSWVPPSVQAGIVRLLRQKVKPGGVAHVSYNALPAWGPAMGLQRLLREGGRRLHQGRSDQQAVEGLKLVQELKSADAYQLVRSIWVKNLIERTEQLPTHYLAHEYMNESWAPCFHADVVNAMAGAKLEWVASGNLPENFPELTLSPEQQAIARRIDDPVLRELIKDMCLNRSLRNDVFVRGARRILPAMRDDTLRDVWLASSISPGELPAEVEMPAGNAELPGAYYGPIVNALACGPRRVGDLLRLPDLHGKRENPAELIGVMVGLKMAEAALRPNAQPVPQASRFNRLITAELGRSENPGRELAAASHLLGTGAPCSLFDLYVLERVQAGEGEADLYDWVQHFGSNMDDEGRAKLREVLTRCLQVRVPMMRSQGVT